MGGWPTGPYPTTGQLILARVSNGRYQVTALTNGTGEVEISQCLTASGMEDFLRGMVAAYDAPRFRAHYELPWVEVEG
jgi:hypothetical protein